MALVLYYLGIAFLFTHELDAMTHFEWRLLFGLRSLPDETASPLFVALHVPLFFAILWLSQHGHARVRDATRLVVGAFLVVHAVLHLLLASAPENEFEGVLSYTLILAAGACGAAYLALALRMRAGGGDAGDASWRQPVE